MGIVFTKSKSLSKLTAEEKTKFNKYKNNLTDSVLRFAARKLANFGAYHIGKKTKECIRHMETLRIKAKIVRPEEVEGYTYANTTGDFDLMLRVYFNTTDKDGALNYMMDFTAPLSVIENVVLTEYTNITAEAQEITFGEMSKNVFRLVK